MTIPTMIIIDHQQGRVTVDGRDIAPPYSIGADPEIEMLDGALARVDLSLYAENVLVISRRGHVNSPTAAHEARQIVRKGLAHILEWLGEDRQDVLALTECEAYTHPTQKGTTA